MNTELYDLLGVKPDASESDIKKAYRKMAILYHPDKINANRDKYSDEEFEEINKKFLKIQNAYEILLDPTKRKIYDNHGEDAVNDPNFSQGINMQEYMNNIFGGNVKVGEPSEQKTVVITLEEYFTKTSLTKKHRIKNKCVNCNSTGSTEIDPPKCKKCGGNKVVMVNKMVGPGIFQRMQQKCDSCSGTGYTISYNNKCEDCDGKGSIDEEIDLVIDIPKNIVENNTVKIKNKGSWIENKNKYADILVVIKLQLTDGYELVGDKKLSYLMEINYPETMCGFSRAINHPSGKTYIIVSEPGIILNPKTCLAINGLGLSGEELLLTFKINYPKLINQIDCSKNLTFDNISELMGKKLVDDVNIDDENIDPDSIIYISQMRDYNNKNNDEHHDEYYGPYEHSEQQCVHQ